MRKAVWVSLALSTVCLPALFPAEAVSFQRQIRPILVKQCQGCHQPASRQSGLLLTSYKSFHEGGKKGAAFVAGDPGQSVVIAYLTGAVKPQMPFGARPLPDDQIELFKSWILEGAKDDSPPEETTMVVPKTDVVYHAAPLINALAFSPDGKLLAVSGYHEILLHNPEGGLIARLPGLSSRIHSLVFSPDGTTLAAVGGDPAQFGEVQIWDVAQRKQRHSIVITNDTLFGASFSPDGKKIACGATDKSVRIIDAVSGKEIRKMDHHEDWVFGTVFGIDGKRLVSVGRDRAAKLIDVESGRFMENVNLLKEPLNVVVRHPKKDWVLVGGLERIPYLYRMDRPRAMRIADDSTLIHKYDKQDGPILALAISPDGQWIAVGAEAGDVHIYNLESGEQAGKCSGLEGGTYALQFYPDSKRLAAAGFDGTIRIFELSGKLAKSFVPVPIEKTVLSQR